jgi:hypothetical protein
MEMELDWLDWRMFLRMLSVERTETFAHELCFPVTSRGYSDIMLGARACIEVEIGSRIKDIEGDPDYGSLADRWSVYRKSGGVLSDDALLDLAPDLLNSSRLLEAALAKLNGEKEQGMCRDLETWFHSRFRPRPDPAWQWPWALRYFFVDTAGTLAHWGREVSTAEWLLIMNWSQRYETEKADLQLRFCYLEREAIVRATPSPWESVLDANSTEPGLQTGDQSNIMSYPWLTDIGRCLSFKLIIDEWNRLKKELGEDALNRIVKLVRGTSDKLPRRPVLPDVPA